jgi:hypothetical protein
LASIIPAAADRPNSVEVAGKPCEPLGRTIISDDKMSILACLYTAPFPEGSVEMPPPLIWKLNTSGQSGGITGGCSVKIGPTKFLNGVISRGLSVTTRWGRGCKDEPNAGINPQTDNCNYAQDIGYRCGTISALPAPTDAKYTPYVCACVQQ